MTGGRQERWTEVLYEMAIEVHSQGSQKVRIANPVRADCLSEGIDGQMISEHV